MYNGTNRYWVVNLMPRKSETTILPSLPMRLRQLRQELGWSLADVAERLGVTQRAVVSNWEAVNQRRRIPDIENLLQLQRWYGVSMDYLLGQTDTDRESAMVRNGRQQLRAALRETTGLIMLTPSDRARLALNTALEQAPDVFFLERTAAFLFLAEEDVRERLREGTWPPDLVGRLASFLGLRREWFYAMDSSEVLETLT